MQDTSKEDCYSFKDFSLNQEKNTSNTLWTKDDISKIDSTYVLYLEGNQERYEQIIEQLNKIQPTKKIWIVHNKSYKTCDKGPNIQKPPQDIVDANLRIFKHAQEQSYRNILVLEDDFLFDERLIHDKQPINDISDFLHTYPDHLPLNYYLGVLPIIQCPIGWTWKHNLVLLSAGTHAVIYNKSYRDMILQIPNPEIEIKDWDIYSIRYIGLRYTYKVPLCYQVFNYTENSAFWGYQSTYISLLSSLFHSFNSYWLHLDTKIEPGYSFYNCLSKILFFFIILLIIFCFILIYTILKAFYRFILRINRIIYNLFLPRKIKKRR